MMWMTVVEHNSHPYGRPKIQVDLDSIALGTMTSFNGGTDFAVRATVKRISNDGEERTETRISKDWIAIALAMRAKDGVPVLDAEDPVPVTPPQDVEPEKWARDPSRVWVRCNGRPCHGLRSCERGGPESKCDHFDQAAPQLGFHLTEAWKAWAHRNGVPYDA